MYSSFRFTQYTSSRTTITAVLVEVSKKEVIAVEVVEVVLVAMTDVADATPFTCADL